MRMIQFARSEIGIEATARNARTARIISTMLASRNELAVPESSENYFHVTHDAGDSDTQIEAEDHAMLATAQQRSKAEASNRGGKRVAKLWRP